MAVVGMKTGTQSDVDGNRIAEYLYDESAGTSSLIREYIWANGSVVGVYENGTLYFVRTDHIMRPVFATDVNGTVAWEASYLPFGGVQASTGPNPDLRFSGQWFQTETGLHQNWMRDYDPTTGRYIQADPLGLVPGPSLYGYAYQSPMMYVDPDGEHPLLFALAFGLGSAAWNAWDQLAENGWRWNCINGWRVAGAGISGAALGPAARALGGSALGLTRFGRGMSINGLVGSASSFRSYTYNAVSKRLRSANGLVGNSSIQLHHWFITQNFMRRLGNPRWLNMIGNSRWNLNPINSKLNRSISNNVSRPMNFWRGAPDWARFGPLGFGAGRGIAQMNSEGCGCEQ